MTFDPPGGIIHFLAPHFPCAPLRARPVNALEGTALLTAVRRSILVLCVSREGVLVSTCYSLKIDPLCARCWSWAHWHCREGARAAFCCPVGFVYPVVFSSNCRARTGVVLVKSRNTKKWGSIAVSLTPVLPFFVACNPPPLVRHCWPPHFPMCVYFSAGAACVKRHTAPAGF